MTADKKQRVFSRYWSTDLFTHSHKLLEHGMRNASFEEEKQK